MSELEIKHSKFPKLHPVEKIVYTIIFPLGIMYILYCFFLFIGLKPTRIYDNQFSKIYKYYESPKTAFDPYAYRPGTALWNFTHRN
jgi:hypothetical protein